MTTKIAILTATILAGSLCSSLMAQSSTGPTSRADVRDETRALEREGRLTPPGQGPQAVVPATSETSRAQRKTATRAAEKAGTLAPAGDAAEEVLDERIRASPSTANRSARKAETRALEKTGKLTPPGEGPGAPRK
jgi:hypothetical protein